MAISEPLLESWWLARLNTLLKKLFLSRVVREIIVQQGCQGNYCSSGLSGKLLLIQGSHQPGEPGKPGKHREFKVENKTQGKLREFR